MSEVKPGGDLSPLYDSLRNVTYESAFAETFMAEADATLKNGARLEEALAGAPIGDMSTTFPGTGLGRQMQTTARLIRARAKLGAERSVYLTIQGGYDTHATFTQYPQLMTTVDDAIDSLRTELIAQGVWNDTIVVMFSEFARTLTSNGKGSDHAWGGNYALIGGALRGGRMLGRFPEHLKDGASLNVGRGRYIPTVPWETLWAPLSRWFGVPESQMVNVLPNLPNFPPSDIFTESDLFQAE